MQAHGHDTDFLCACVHLESPIGPKSPLKTFFGEQRRIQAEQVGCHHVQQSACCRCMRTLPSC